jgi:hypothetical protein
MYFSLLGMVLVVFLFFSLAATKMPSFTIAVAMLVFIAFAALFYGVLEFLAKHVKSKGLNVFIFIASKYRNDKYKIFSNNHFLSNL